MGNILYKFDSKEVQKECARQVMDAERCPHCHDQGWYVVGGEEPEQEQCQFCWENERSLFNLLRGWEYE